MSDEPLSIFQPGDVIEWSTLSGKTRRGSVLVVKGGHLRVNAVGKTGTVFNVFTAANLHHNPRKANPEPK